MGHVLLIRGQAVDPWRADWLLMGGIRVYTALMTRSRLLVRRLDPAGRSYCNG